MASPQLDIDQSTFIIVANGFAEGPAQALRDYLVAHHAPRVITVAHPLTPENEAVHIVTTYQNGRVTTKRRRLPNKPPKTFLFDPFVPLRLPKSTAWFGFNNLACVRGLARRKAGRTKKVYYWAVDFVPERFGKSLATKVYDRVDRYVTKNVDGRIDLSQAALEGRSAYHQLSKDQQAPAYVVPMGAWLKRTPKISDKAWAKQKLVYLGHLVQRQGVANMVGAMAELVKHNPKIGADIIGSGPLEQNLRKQAKELGLAKHITFHGFVKEHKDVEAILAGATVAVAPYVIDKDSFSQFADPGKLKAYLGAYLPTVLTPVPPNARELADAGAAVLVNDNPTSLAKGVRQLLDDEKAWQQAHQAAIKMAQQYDWDVILKDALEKLGFK